LLGVDPKTSATEGAEMVVARYHIAVERWKRSVCRLKNGLGLGIVVTIRKAKLGFGRYIESEETVSWCTLGQARPTLGTNNLEGMICCGG